MYTILNRNDIKPTAQRKWTSVFENIDSDFVNTNLCGKEEETIIHMFTMSQCSATFK